MPAFIKQLTSDGLRDVTYHADSLDEAIQYETSQGIYTISNTYEQTKVLRLDAHLDRLQDSAKRLNIPLDLNRTQLRAALREMIQAFGFGDVRFRLTIDPAIPDEVTISLEPFTRPSEAIRKYGVRAITHADAQRTLPKAKTTDWMHNRRTLKNAMPEGIYEIFLLSAGGYIMEGLGSNFYAILNDELHTASEGVLPGIARQIVYQIAPTILPLNNSPVHISELSDVKETFLTSSSRGIIPVIEIDNMPIGTGITGDITKQLQESYNQWVNEHLEEL